MTYRHSAITYKELSVEQILLLARLLSKKKLCYIELYEDEAGARDADGDLLSSADGSDVGFKLNDLVTDEHKMMLGLMLPERKKARR